MTGSALIDIDKIDEVELDEFFQQIHSLMESGDSKILPDDRLSARKWLLAVLRYESEIDYLKNEYKTALLEKYISPVDKKIGALGKSVSYLKDGLLQFLRNADQKSVNFPDLGTITQFDGQDKIVYPDDEAALAEALLASGQNQFVTTKYAINKKAISEHYKQTGEIPVSGLVVEKALDSVRIRKASIS
jgi:phage host-nuclease inhibitor protein Gam